MLGIIISSMAPVKKTYILESAAGKALGTFTGSTPGIAAKKASTKGHTDIILRETGEHDKRRIYKGSVTTLNPPKQVTIAGKPVLITKKSVAKFIKVENKKQE
jgi:hypothetical protein